jgi:hypothetical protein
MGPPPGRPFGPPPPQPYYNNYHRHNHDFDRALGVMAAIGVTAAVANGISRYNYYRYAEPPVVYVPNQTTVVVEQPTETISRSDKQETYSPKLGASFQIEKMQIPGYKFTAARLMSKPVEGSPLEKAGFAEGDVITRLDNSRVDNLAELERHERDTSVRYIKAGTTTVQLAKIYIPTDQEALQDSEGVAP